MFVFFFNKIGCVGSILLSVIGTVLMLALFRGCAGAI
jgi:hypothetical protein